MSGKIKKLIIFLAIVAVLGGLYLFDFIASKQYSYSLVKSTITEVIADGYSPAKITVRLNKGGKPVAGHTINIVASNGTIVASRLVTNNSGDITFTYYSYLYLDDVLTPLEDVTFYLSDESNSVFFMVPATCEIRYPAVKPEEETVWEDWQNIKLDEQG